MVESFFYCSYCDGLNEKCPPQAPLLEHLVPTWWRCLGKFRGDLNETGPHMHICLNAWLFGGTVLD